MCLCNVTLVVGDFLALFTTFYVGLEGMKRNRRRKRLPALSLLFTFSSLVKHSLSAAIPISLHRHVSSRGNSRDATGFVSRGLPILAGLVGRAVVLDGGALGSGGLRLATLSTRQVVREGPGARASWCRETCCVSSL